MMDWLPQNIRFSIRALMKKPSFTTIAILTVALGIGANTAIFSIVNAVLLHRPPFNNAERLVVMWGTAPQVNRTPVSAANFFDYRERNHSFQNMAAFTATNYIVTSIPSPERVRTGIVTPEFFNTLGVNAALGRLFYPEDGQAGRNNVVLMSHGLWVRAFGSDPNIVGKSLSLNSTSCRIAGVLPPGFEFSLPGFFRDPDLWMPLPIVRNNAQRRNNNLRVIAQLKPDVTLQQAQSDINGIAKDLSQQFPGEDAGMGAKLVSLHDQVVGDIRPALLLLLGVVAAVLLIACANVTNLQLERTNAQKKEITMRLALGASRRHILRQSLVESLLLALLGGVLGVLLAIGGIVLLQYLFPGKILQDAYSVLDLKVLGFSLLLSILTGIIFGLAPAFRVTPSLALELKEGSQNATSTRAFGRLRSLLVVAEFALSLLLLVASGLLVKSFVQLLNTPLGFDPKNALAVRIDLPRYAYKGAPDQLAFYQRAIDGIRAIPGVQSAGGIDDLPLAGGRDSDTFFIEGYPVPPTNDLPLTEERSVTPDYFRAMDIPLISGRSFADADSPTSDPVVLINRTLARQFFLNDQPIGKHLRLGTLTEPSSPWLQIVGIVGDTRDISVESLSKPEIYRPYSQAPLPSMNLVVRGSVEPSTLGPSIRGYIHTLDAGLPTFATTSMTEVLAQAFAERKFVMFLVSLFAVLALVLAAIGIYGVIAYSVAQRTQEIGIRMALGARSKDVLLLILKQGAFLALYGICGGLLLAVFLAKLMSGMVYALSTWDIATYAWIIVVLLLVACLACYLPARRATRVEPTVALRNE